MIENIIAKASEMKGSDIHIVCGIPVRVRVDGKLVLPEAVQILKVTPKTTT